MDLDRVFDDFRSVVEDAQSDVPRFVVLGPPGSGKTTLVQYLAWKAAKKDFAVLGRERVPARIRVPEWEHRAPGLRLEGYLASEHQSIYPAPTVEQWREWLQNGDVFLLLDGLDELGANAAVAELMKEALCAFRQCPTILTCRTVSFEQYRLVCPEFPVFALAGFNEEARTRFIECFPSQSRFDRRVLIDQIERIRSMRPLSTNPFLLGIMCLAIDGRGGTRLPATRAELYSSAIDRLLATQSRITVKYPGPEPGPSEKRRILERVALNLCLADQQAFVLSDSEFKQHLDVRISWFSAEVIKDE